MAPANRAHHGPPCYRSRVPHLPWTFGRRVDPREDRRVGGRVGGRVARGALLGLALAAGSAPPAAAEPPNTHEVLTSRPSGFWTSNQPATHGAYRWRLLGLGVVIAAATGYGMLRLIRRASAERAGKRDLDRRSP